MAKTDAGTRAEDIAAKGDNVRERVRHAFVETVRNRDLSMERLDKTAREMIDGAVEGVKRLAPEKRDSALRQVVDGLADGFATAANATRYAFEEARSRGDQFARADVDQIMKNLRGLQDRFIETINDAAHRAASEIGIQAGALREHARRAYEGARPAVESATRAALEHPVRLAGETASTGAHALPRAIGTVFHALSGALQGAGDLLTGKAEAAESSRRKSTKKKAASSRTSSAKKTRTKKKSSKKKASGTSSKKTKKKSTKKSGKKSKTKKKAGKKAASKKKTASKKAGKKKSGQKKASRNKSSSKKKSSSRKARGKKKSSRK